MMSVGLCVCRHDTTTLPLDGLSWNFVFENFSKICRGNIKLHTAVTRITDTLHKELRKFMTTFPWILLKMRNFSDKIVQKIRNHILCSTFSRKPCHLWNNVKKNMQYSETWYMLQYNKRQKTSVFMPNEQGYTQALITIYCFSAVTMVYTNVNLQYVTSTPRVFINYKTWRYIK
jgi:hypothetical protein